MYDYKTPVAKYLESIGVSFNVLLLGDSCPMFCEDRGKPGIGTFPRENHIHGQHWQATFARNGSVQDDALMSPLVLIVDFWDSYNDAAKCHAARNWGGMDYRFLRKIGATERESNMDCFAPEGWRNLAPSAYDVLSCVGKQEPGTFGEWASEFGYDTDSRKAETIYRAVADEWSKVSRFFTAGELERLQEIAV